jgi:hypothetical protein
MMLPASQIRLLGSYTTKGVIISEHYVAYHEEGTRLV